jgi:hypothetical protein
LCKWLHYLKHSILPVLLPSKFQWYSSQS